MTDFEPKPGEPGYWATKLRDATTEADFVESYIAHSRELKKHGALLLPYDVLCQRLIGRFGQYGAEKEDDPRREDAIFVLREVQRYLALSGLNMRDGISLASAVKKRTTAEFEADVACSEYCLKGFSRTSAERREVFPASRPSPLARKHAASVDTGCTGMDDHDPAPCQKCSDIHEAAGLAIDTAVTEYADALRKGFMGEGYVGPRA